MFYLVLLFLLWFTLTSSRSIILINPALFPTLTKMVTENLTELLAHSIKYYSKNQPPEVFY